MGAGRQSGLCRYLGKRARGNGIGLVVNRHTVKLREGCQRFQIFQKFAMRLGVEHGEDDVEPRFSRLFRKCPAF